METIILISVLSTVGVVTLLLSIVVAFIKLKSKVDGNSYNIAINDIHRRIDDVINENENKVDRLITLVYENMNQIQNDTNNRFDDTMRMIDSRCDKLDAKIKATSEELMPKTDKQILND
jgi:prefoldin subunit 5